MTVEWCRKHNRNTCACPKVRYADPRTGGVINVIPRNALPPVR